MDGSEALLVAVKGDTDPQRVQVAGSYAGAHSRMSRLRFISTLREPRRWLLAPLLLSLFPLFRLLSLCVAQLVPWSPHNNERSGN